MYTCKTRTEIELCGGCGSARAWAQLRGHGGFHRSCSPNQIWHAKMVVRILFFFPSLMNFIHVDKLSHAADPPFWQEDAKYSVKNNTICTECVYIHAYICTWWLGKVIWMAFNVCVYIYVCMYICIHTYIRQRQVTTIALDMCVLMHVPQAHFLRPWGLN